MKITDKEYLRSVLFGLEDSLVSTTGLIAGISIGSDNTKFVFLAGIVAVCIEAVSMGVGEYLSDDAIQELDKIKRHRDNPLLSGLLMFISYFLIGILLLLPTLLLPLPSSLIATTILAFFCLFLLGYIKGTLLKTTPWRGGLKILLVGGITTLLGLFIGFFFRTS